jgi:GMP synthase (glutamine-hydrolysing)
MASPEIGMFPIKLAFASTTDPILAGLPWDSPQVHCHGYEVTELPPDGVPLAGSAACRQQAFRVGMKTYAFQFHFEWTRNDLNDVIAQSREWINKAGFNIQQIEADIDEYFYLQRHLGDRLCRNIADFLFPIDKRLRHTKGPAENFHASYF